MGKPRKTRIEKQSILARALRPIAEGQIVTLCDVDPRPTIHVVGLPHTIPDDRFNHCAFTGKLRRFPDVARLAGYRTIEYSNGASQSTADEHVTIFSEAELVDYFGPRLLGETTGGKEGATHQDKENTEAFFAQVKRALKKRLQPGDLIAHIFEPRPDMVSQFKANAHVETGIGYANGPWGAYRIFESETWRAWHMGRHSATEGGGVPWGEGRPDPYPHFAALTTTAVVPNYYRGEDWEAAVEDTARAWAPRRYCVFVGRMASIKGIEIVDTLAGRNPGVDFVCVSGEPRSDRLVASNIVWRGKVDSRAELSRLYAEAACTLIPSMFHEPFGGVCAEALLSGCPVIASNFAAFVEHVGEDDGILASGHLEFEISLKKLLAEPIETLETRQARRARAVARWGYDAVARQYAAAFAAIQRNWTQGILPEGHPGK